MYSPVRVSMRIIVAGVDEQRHTDLSTGLQSGGLGSVGGSVAGETGIGIGYFQLYKVRRLYTEYHALVGQDLAVGVLLDELEVVAQLARR